MLLKFGSAESIFYIYRERGTIVANFEIANIEKNNISSESVLVSISSREREKEKKYFSNFTRKIRTKTRNER